MHVKTGRGWHREKPPRADSLQGGLPFCAASLRENLVDDMAMNIGQAPVDSVVAESQFLVAYPQQKQAIRSANYKFPASRPYGAINV